MPKDESLLSGKSLEEHVGKLYTDLQAVLPLKETIHRGNICAISVYRCKRLEQLIEMVIS